MMKYVAVILTLAFLILQMRLWHGDGSLLEVIALYRQSAEQKRVIAEYNARNQQLLAEVQDLKHRLGAVEERARIDLGMMREGEVFYQIISPEDAKLLAPKPPEPQSEAEHG
jgi:cell division protein FtsB